jgi:hypothetical protein
VDLSLADVRDGGQLGALPEGLDGKAAAGLKALQ